MSKETDNQLKDKIKGGRTSADSRREDRDRQSRDPSDRTHGEGKPKRFTEDDTYDSANPRNAPVTTDGQVASLADSPSEMCKTIVIVALRHLSYPGDVLSGLVGFLWPPGDQGEVLKQLQEEVYLRMNYRELDPEDMNFFAERLNLVGFASQLYLMMVKAGNADLIRGQWASTNAIFHSAADDIVTHQWVSPDWSLCPFIGIFALLHLSLLRDARLYGLSWGMTAEFLKQQEDAAKTQLKAYIDCMSQLIESERESRGEAQFAPKHFDFKRRNFFNFWQPFQQGMIFGYDDYLVLFRHLYPEEPTTNKDIDGFKDIHSSALGVATTWDYECDINAFEGGVVGPTWSLPLRNASSFRIWESGREPYHITMTWPEGTGPFEHRDTTSRRAQTVEGPINAFDLWTGESGREVEIDTEPTEFGMFTLRGANVRVSQTVPALFEVVDRAGKVTEVWNSGIEGGVYHRVAFPGRWFATVSAWTLNYYFDYHIGSVILGFTRDVTETPPEVLELLSITAVASLPEELAKKMSVGEKEASKKAREAYWAYIRKLHKVE